MMPAIKVLRILAPNISDLNLQNPQISLRLFQKLRENPRMSTIIFIALQCVQCSTMQVKQRKKSSNKWTCVVCNQKQSIIKVFAQGPKAKDLRLFVQSFNMSRKIADENQPLAAITEYDIELEDDERDGGRDLVVDDQKKRRTDWTAYLDTEDHQEDLIKQEEEEGVDFKPKIVTELPTEMFKRPKLRNYGGDGSYKPVFSKRNTKRNEIPNTISQGHNQHEARVSNGSSGSIWSESTRTLKESRTPPESKPARGASKWNDYITQDDDGGDCVDDIFQMQIQYSTSQKVEDDIHPDCL